MAAPNWWETADGVAEALEGVAAGPDRCRAPDATGHAMRALVALLAGVNIRAADILHPVTTVLGPALDVFEAHVQATNRATDGGKPVAGRIRAEARDPHLP
ncbi:hypothetical protein ACFRCG_33680 [Embleya sp. NPDC056575]|uniref:hypothetical protein n=1 Tax=unclassified Embleya TaxID=2699296 RepID=UPI003685E55A